MTKKRCGTCKLDETGTKFYAGKRWTCIPCWSAYSKKRRDANIEQYRNKSKLQRRKKIWGDLGLTFEGYEDMLRGQNGKCAICEATQYTKKGGTLAVDHDHFDGQIRGLLCRSCNLLIGHASDDPETLKRAIAYLENAQGRKMKVV